MAKYHITIIRPPGYVHSDCFFEIAEGLRYAIGNLGHAVTFAENWIEPGAKAIVFGAHLLSEESAEALPDSAVVYNLEQLGFSWTPDWYMQLASRLQIWDFTPLHIATWESVPCLLPVALLEIGYAPPLRRIVSSVNPDIDVLFYGSTTERRQRVLDALSADGIKVYVCFGVYGAERDALIGRSKIVLNLHAAETDIFEAVRVSYLLANAKAVVCEESADFGPLREAVAVCEYATTLAVCKRLLDDQQERSELEQRGFKLFSARHQTEILAGIVGRGDTARCGPGTLPDLSDVRVLRSD